MSGQFDAIIIGTGFASAFFLHRYLERGAPNARVLVLEKGEAHSHPWQLANRRAIQTASLREISNQTPDKKWRFSIAFGGGSVCWWACTPRLMPNDFRLHSAYGVGRDWPLSYDDLELYYQRAEELMAVAGPSDRTPFPRSSPYPQPPHEMNEPDRLLAAAYPDGWFVQPSARPSRTIAGERPRCCANAVCSLCPIDSKFTIQNGMRGLFDDPRVTLELGASAQAVDTVGGVAASVSYRSGGRDHTARADLVVLGANALFNPHILMRSGISHPLLGRHLFEQASIDVDVDLDGVTGFGGSTVITGHGYLLYDGEHRRERPAVLIESLNAPFLREERGKWRQRMRLRCIFEDLPRAENRVRLSPARPEAPEIAFEGRSDYVARGRAVLEGELGRVLTPLPVERIEMHREWNPTESHILGTAVMGTVPESSVVDSGLVHHQVRNLLVLGGSAFPTGSPANPTLTIAALSLRSADRLLGSGVG